MVILKDRILEFHPDTLVKVRKEVNLEKEGRIEEAVDILDEWVTKQQHFMKKDFSRDYLERTLITAKGLVERAKMRIDKLCTFKTLMPELYPSTVCMKHYENLYNYVMHGCLPKLTEENYRVYILRLTADDFDTSIIHNFYNLVVVLNEYLRIRDYNSGYIVVLDYRHVNIMNFITKCTPMELRQIITLMTEGYSMRIKQIHIVTPSKMVDAIVILLKQVLSAKLAGRIHVHKNLDTLYEFVPKTVLPEEYGGAERSFQKISDEWQDALSAPDFVEYYEEMCNAKTNETHRRSDKFSEQYGGMPGSFRALSVD